MSMKLGLVGLGEWPGGEEDEEYESNFCIFFIFYIFLHYIYTVKVLFVLHILFRRVKRYFCMVEPLEFLEEELRRFCFTVLVVRMLVRSEKPSAVFHGNVSEAKIQDPNGHIPSPLAPAISSFFSSGRWTYGGLFRSSSCTRLGREWGESADWAQLACALS